MGLLVGWKVFLLFSMFMLLFNGGILSRVIKNEKKKQSKNIKKVNDALNWKENEKFTNLSASHEKM